MRAVRRLSWGLGAGVALGLAVLMGVAVAEDAPFKRGYGAMASDPVKVRSLANRKR